MDKIKAFLPTPQQIVKGFIVIAICVTVVNALGVPNLLFNPIQFFKDKFGK